MAMLKKLPHKNLFYFGFLVVFVFIGLSYWQLTRYQQDKLIIDSIDSKDFINTFPIEGGEEVELAIKHSFNKNAQRYIFRVYKITSRIIDGKKQVYNLLLVSEEALVNESVRVCLLYTSPSPRDVVPSRMPSSA